MNFSVIYSAVTIILLGTLISGESNVSEYKLINSENCGKAKIQSRITGGEKAGLGRYPWMARLGYTHRSLKIRFRCGGSLINTRYVITASHCIHGYEEIFKVVRLGEYITDTAEDCNGKICAPPVQDFLVGKYYKHPDYDHSKVKNDIAIVLLSREAEYNDFVRPICLPRGDILTKNYIAQRVEVAGWGVVDSSTNKESNTLLYVNLPIRDLCACSEIMPHMEFDETQYCVGLETGEDSCVGDSGGPMMKLENFEGKKRYHLLGVISLGKSFCGENPAIYTKVIKYMDWILEVINTDEGEFDITTEEIGSEYNWYPTRNERQTLHE